MGVAGRLAVVGAIVVLSACGGGGEDKADEPDCPTTTGPLPTATTTIDPRCVVRGTEKSGEATGQEWKGTIDGTGVNNPEGATCPNPAVIFSGDFTMTVAPDGNATMTGLWVDSSPCGGGRTYRYPFTLQGKKTDSRVSFAPAGEIIWPLNMDITGHTAVGVIDDDPSPMYHITVTFNGQCLNC